MHGPWICIDHAVDRFVDGVESRFDCSPMLYHDHRPVSEFRRHGTKVGSRKNMTSSFEDTKHKRSCIPSLSEQRGDTQNAKQIYRAYIISY